MVTIDFETRSCAKLKLVGAYKYAEDRSTTILCMAYNVTGDPVDTRLWLPESPFPQVLKDAIDQGHLFEAHNSFFEHCIWQRVGVPKFDFPQLPLNRWRCSAAKCRANGLPGSLGAAGAVLGLNVQKDSRGKYLIKKLCEPRKPTKSNPNKWVDDKDLFDELYAYCITDVNSEMELSKKLPDLSEKETKVWLLDQLINWRGFYIDEDTIQATLQILEQKSDSLNAKLGGISKGAFTTSGQRDKIIAWCQDQGVALSGYTKDDVDRALSDPNLSKPVKEVLEIRQMLGRTSTAKYQKMLTQKASDGRIHEVFMYHAAHTGRWGGSGVQIQNLPRPTIKDDPEYIVDILKTRDLDEVDLVYSDPYELASSAIRSMITPAPGNKFISADYAAIEARGVMWLAEDYKALDVFRRGECIYCQMAASIYGLSYDALYNRYKAGDKDADQKRFIGKQAILGLGYQMGATRFKGQCAAYGVEIHDDFAEQVVSTFRSKFLKVKQLWGNLETAASTAMQNLNESVQCGKIKFLFDGTTLKCKLPSGRVFKYPYASYRLSTTKVGERKAIHYFRIGGPGGKWVETTTYGGKLTENIVQAISRDIMAEAMLRLEANGYTILMSVHDEAVSEVPEGFGSVEEYCKIMCEMPDWAAGLPLTAEGWEGHRYRK